MIYSDKQIEEFIANFLEMDYEEYDNLRHVPISRRELIELLRRHEGHRSVKMTINDKALQIIRDLEENGFNGIHKFHDLRVTCSSADVSSATILVDPDFCCEYGSHQYVDYYSYENPNEPTYLKGDFFDDLEEHIQSVLGDDVEVLLRRHDEEIVIKEKS